MATAAHSYNDTDYFSSDNLRESDVSDEKHHDVSDPAAYNNSSVNGLELPEKAGHKSDQDYRHEYGRKVTDRYQANCGDDDRLVSGKNGKKKHQKVNAKYPKMMKRISTRGPKKVHAHTNFSARQQEDIIANYVSKICSTIAAKCSHYLPLTKQVLENSTEFYIPKDKKTDSKNSHDVQQLPKIDDEDMPIKTFALNIPSKHNGKNPLSSDSENSSSSSDNKSSFSSGDNDSSQSSNLNPQQSSKRNIFEESELPSDVVNAICRANIPKGGIFEKKFDGTTVHVCIRPSEIKELPIVKTKNGARLGGKWTSLMNKLLQEVNSFCVWAFHRNKIKKDVS